MELLRKNRDGYPPSFYTLGGLLLVIVDPTKWPRVCLTGQQREVEVAQEYAAHAGCSSS